MGSTTQALIEFSETDARCRRPWHAACHPRRWQQSVLRANGHRQRLPVDANRGIIDYSPTELVITARAGTPLDGAGGRAPAQGTRCWRSNRRISAHGATLGGTIACGLSGPRRPYAGAVRDFVLGMNCINGKGE